MDQQYIQLFKLIARNTSNLAERVMEDHEKLNEEKGAQTARQMRDDYLNLYNKLKSEEVLNKADYARLLVGTFIMIENIENRIKNEQKALSSYKIDILPKLDQINNADANETIQLAEKLFEIKKETI